MNCSNVIKGLKYEILYNRGKVAHNAHATKQIVYPIRAIRDIPMHNVKAGDLGGYVSTPHSLSQYGDCWVGEDSYIMDDAFVVGYSLVSGTTLIADNCCVQGRATICGTVKLTGGVVVSDEATINGGVLWIEGPIVIGDRAKIIGNHGHIACDMLKASEIMCFQGIFGDACINLDSGYPVIRVNPARFGGNALIRSNNDYLTIGPIGSRNDYTTFFRTKDEGVGVCCGCFTGTLQEFKDAVIKTHFSSESDGRHYKNYMTAIEMAKSYFNL